MEIAMPGKYDPATDEILVRIRGAGSRMQSGKSSAKKELVGLLSVSLAGVGRDYKSAWTARVNCALRAIEDSLPNFGEMETAKICGLLRDSCAKSDSMRTPDELVNKLMCFMAMIYRKNRRGGKEALVELARNPCLVINAMAADKLARMGFDRFGNWVRDRRPGAPTKRKAASAMRGV
jgi:hypothetical protein